MCAWGIIHLLAIVRRENSPKGARPDGVVVDERTFAVVKGFTIGARFFSLSHTLANAAAPFGAPIAQIIAAGGMDILPRPPGAVAARKPSLDVGVCGHARAGVGCPGRLSSFVNSPRDVEGSRRTNR